MNLARFPARLVTDLNLSTRLLLGFATPIALLVVILAVTLTAIASIQAAFLSVSDDSLPAVTALDKMKFVSSRLISSSNEYILDTYLGSEEGEGDDDDDEAAEVEDSIADYNAAFDQYRRLANEMGSGQFLTQIEMVGQTLITVSSEIIALHPSEQPLAEALALRQTIEEVEAAFLEVIDAATAHEERRLEEREVQVGNVTAQARTVAVIVTLAAILAAGVLSRVIFRSVTHPLSALNAAAQRIRAGEMKARTGFKLGDEIGLVGQTFDRMAENIEKLVADLKQQVEVAQSAQRRAEQSEKTRAAFLASMSHELRTPLNAVINFTQFVVDGDTGPVNEQQKELLTEVVGSGKHLLSLINDVLDMTKIEAGSLMLFIEDDIDLSAMLESVAATGRSLLGDKDVRLLLDVKETLPLVRGDSRRIYQILLNILSNACKFTGQGEIQMRAEQIDGEIRVAISDTGPGIAPPDQALVFEAFKQTESGLRQGGGTGLGMPIARSLVQAHGGRLWLESEPGKGSTFYVALPLRSEALNADMVQPA